jgi:polyisoprenoid-binding protein YceI
MNEMGLEDNKSDLSQHLMNADFFDGETDPSATFGISNGIKSGNTYRINGNHTIKGVQKEDGLRPNYTIMS